MSPLRSSYDEHKYSESALFNNSKGQNALAAAVASTTTTTTTPAVNVVDDDGEYESADEFSLIEEPFIPGGYPAMFSSSTLPNFRDGPSFSGPSAGAGSGSPNHNSSSLKSLLPRLWDVLSSPSRSIFTSPTVSSSSASSLELPQEGHLSRSRSPRTNPSSPSSRRKRYNIPVPGIGQSWYHSANRTRIAPATWSNPSQDASGSSGKSTTHALLFSRSGNGSPPTSSLTFKKQKHRKLPSDFLPRPKSSSSSSSPSSKPKSNFRSQFKYKSSSTTTTTTKAEETRSSPTSTHLPNPDESEEVDYTTLAPLDGEEGELIDDEACYFVGFAYGYRKFGEGVEERVNDKEKEKEKERVTGLDMLTNLPQELSIHILTLLSPPPPPPLSTLVSSSLSAAQAQNPQQQQQQATTTPTPIQTILTCRLVSRSWCRLASDNEVWRALFYGRWGVDLSRGGRGRVFGSESVEEFLVHEEMTKWRKGKGVVVPGMQLGSSWFGDMTALVDNDHASDSDSDSDDSNQTPKSKSESRVKASTHQTRSIGSKSKRPVPIPKRLPAPGPVPVPLSTSPLLLDWRVLYRERIELERRWEGGKGCVALSEFGLSGGGRSVGKKPEPEHEVKMGRYEPKPMRITGHSDSVYCLEFDSRRIITGSRDKKIKVWSLKSGKLLGTFGGQHSGSVLCLKFEKDWERGWDDDDDDDDDCGDDDEGGGEEEEEEDEENEENGGGGEEICGEETNLKKKRRPQPRRLRPGFMVSGSSDCTVCVWDLYLGGVVGSTDVDADTDTEGEEDSSSSSSSSGSASTTRNQNGRGGGGRKWRKRTEREGHEQGKEREREVRAEVRAVLRGHSQGVLDLRIDKRWIVSCSKDAVIRVWDRKTLELYRVLRGHEGPVNAVGLQSGRVVSASGDGKLILWDIESGERLRTFEGHNRGLACIEYKGDLIVSGSNDCKIKIWSASTGECLRDLTGHSALVRALSFDPLSGRLVSASYDRSIKVWDLGSGKMVREFKGVEVHTSHIFDVKFDVGRIVSTSHDQKIVVHDFSVGLNTSLFI